MIREYDSAQHNQSVSLKYNLDMSANKMDTIKEVLLYGKSCFDTDTPIMVSVGEHSDGEKPHIHINLVGTNRVEGDLKHNASRHRKRFWNDYIGHHPPKQISCKVGECDDVDSVIRCLSYPFKEGKVIKLPSSISKLFQQFTSDTVSFLRENGEAIYKQAQYNRLYKERQNVRQGALKDAVMELSKPIDVSIGWIEWRNKVWTLYFDKIEYDEMPDFQIFEKVVQKVAVSRGVCPPYTFCRA